MVLGGLGLLAAVAIGAGVWAGAFWVGALGHTADTMDPAIIASLETQGITLAPPSTTSVPIGKEQAKAIAFQHFPNSNPSTAILANVVVQKNARSNCTCWVVSGPPGGNILSNQFGSWLAYNVTFIDAQSGKYEFEAGSRPFVSGGPLPGLFGSKPSPK